MIAWAGFALALLELVFIIAVVVLIYRFWRQVAPQVAPLLSMFAPPDAVPFSRENDQGPPE